MSAITVAAAGSLPSAYGSFRPRLERGRHMRVSKLRVGVTLCERQQPLVECPTATVTVSRFKPALRAAQSVHP